MYVYTVPLPMRISNDPFEERDSSSDTRDRIALYVVLAGGAGLLAFLTWLLTL
jgi:hypothetical protein